MSAKLVPSAARAWPLGFTPGVGQAHVAYTSDESLAGDIDAASEVDGPVSEFLFEVVDELFAVARAPCGRIPTKESLRAACVVGSSTHARVHVRLRRA
jgi:hypothetical protein